MTTTPPNTVWTFVMTGASTYEVEIQLVDENDDPITQFASAEWRIVLGTAGAAQGFYASSPSDWTAVDSSTKRLTITVAQSTDFPINNANFDFKIIAVGGAVYPIISRGTAQVMPFILEPD